MENLYGYIFWYNHHEECWYAIERDSQLEFFNGSRSKARFWKSTKVDTLIELLSKPNLLNKIENE